MTRIITEHICVGGWDFWRAHDDDLGADASPYGDGKTEAEAIADLEWQLPTMERAE